MAQLLRCSGSCHHDVATPSDDQTTFNLSLLGAAVVVHLVSPRPRPAAAKSFGRLSRCSVRRDRSLAVPMLAWIWPLIFVGWFFSGVTL